MAGERLPWAGLGGGVGSRICKEDLAEALQPLGIQHRLLRCSQHLIRDLVLRHHCPLRGCGRRVAGQVQLKLAPQTLDALGFQSQDFIQLGHNIFKILRKEIKDKRSFSFCWPPVRICFSSPSSCRKFSEPGPAVQLESLQDSHYGTGLRLISLHLRNFKILFF